MRRTPSTSARSAPVVAKTGMSRVDGSWRSAFRMLKPSPPGMYRSRSAMSGGVRRTCCIASSAERALMTPNPSPARIISLSSRKSSSSSTTRTFGLDDLRVARHRVMRSSMSVPCSATSGLSGSSDAGQGLRIDTVVEVGEQVVAPLEVGEPLGVDAIPGDLLVEPAETGGVGLDPRHRVSDGGLGLQDEGPVARLQKQELAGGL